MRIDEVKPADVRALFQQLEAEGKYDTLRKIAEITVHIFNFGIAVGKCENNPAYSIWKGLSFKRPDPNRGFATITRPEKVGKLLQVVETPCPRNAAWRHPRPCGSLHTSFCGSVP